MYYLLFVYGTLLEPGNPFADHLTKHAKYIMPGRLQGKLYDIGEYPGLVISNNDNEWVTGHIYRLADDTLRLIDSYEGYGPGEDAPNLYVRVIRSVQINTGLVDTWVYLYNLPVNGLPLIEQGDYLEYIGKKKSPGL